MKYAPFESQQNEALLSIVTKMEAKEFRARLSASFWEKTTTETKERLDKYYGDTVPSILVVKKWFTEFQSNQWISSS